MARYNSVNPIATVAAASAVTPIGGELTTLAGTPPYTVTLASPLLVLGQDQVFFNSTAGVITLSTPAGNLIGPGFTAATSQTIPAGATYTITSDGTNYVITNNEGGPQAVTTLTASGTLTANGTLTATSTVGLSPANANVTISPTGTGTVTINPAGALQVTGAGTLTLGTVGQTETHRGNMDASQANQTVTLSPSGTGGVTISPGGTGSVTMAPTVAGNINNMNVGATTRGTGAFTTLAANNTMSLSSTSATHTISSTQASSGTGSGALIISGGLGVAGTATVGNLSTSGTLTSSGTTTVTGTFTFGGNAVLTAVQAPYLGTNSIIRTNAQTINESITIPAGTAGMSAGPITIAAGQTITVNGDWSIV
jgi:hypothetical protein